MGENIKRMTKDEEEERRYFSQLHVLKLHLFPLLDTVISFSNRGN